MTLVMAILFFVAGGICTTQPERIVARLVEAMERTGARDAAAHSLLKGPGVILFVRIVGILALINAVMLLYVASQPLAGP